jgi:F0F1-type ATP synthase membrane subunit c/vacuolar-type H+-ATPase subunit K
MNEYQGPATPRQALLIARIIWAMLLLGQLVFAVVVLGLALSRTEERATELGALLLWVALGMLVLAVVAGYFIRNQTYKAHWREHSVAPQGYVTGNIILLAMLEATAFFSLIAVLATGVIFPMILPGAAALVVQLINFPTGKAMQPTEPIFPARDPS